MSDLVERKDIVKYIEEFTDIELYHSEWEQLENAIKKIPAAKSSVTLSTGIVRRVDDLGRIVIPKDIRRLADIDIKECTPVEIGYDFKRNVVILKRYEPGTEDI